MKRLSFLSIILVFMFTLSYPMGPMAQCSAMKQKAAAGLACYCCSGAGQACAVFSACSNCRHDAGSHNAAWSYETLLTEIRLAIPFQPLYSLEEKAVTLKIVYQEAPYKPPES